MTAVERTVVDVPHRPELGGRVEEVLKSLDLVRYLDPVKVADYVEMLDNRSLASIAGWWLETRRAALGVTDDIVAPCGHGFHARHRYDGQNPPEIAYWERCEWWLCGESRPWHPNSVTVVSDRFVFRPKLVPLA